jgi:hypothetical protein
MADELYRYTSNKDPWDGTGSIIVGENEDGSGKVLVKGGDPVALTEEELARARQNYNVVKLSDEQAEKYSADDEATEEPQPSGRSRRGQKTSTERPDADGGVVDPSQGGSASNVGDAPVSATATSDNPGGGR